MSEKPILYMTPLSPPCRAVFLTGAALGIDFELKQVDFSNGEHKSPEYLKVHTINVKRSHLERTFHTMHG